MSLVKARGSSTAHPTGIADLEPEQKSLELTCLILRMMIENLLCLAACPSGESRPLIGVKAFRSGSSTDHWQPKSTRSLSRKAAGPKTKLSTSSKRDTKLSLQNLTGAKEIANLVLANQWTPTDLRFALSDLRAWEAALEWNGSSDLWLTRFLLSAQTDPGSQAEVGRLPQNYLAGRTSGI